MDEATPRKRKPGGGRKPGSSPVGNPPGSHGSPKLTIRLAPADHERVAAAGGATWARQAILEALDRLGK